jgi:flagellar hook-basal body complex protein FliE
MAIGAIGVGGGITAFQPPVISAPAPTTPGDNTGSAGATNFARALDNVSAMEGGANDLATQVATGALPDLHQFTTAATKAQLGLELTVAVRNKAIESFQEIMRMQV